MISIRQLLLVIFIAGVPGATAHAEAGRAIDLVFFYGRGCPHCAAMKQFLDTMQAKHPQLRVRDYEVYFDGENARLFERVADAYHFKIAGVPTIFLGNDALTGFSDEMAPTLEAKIEHCIEQHCGSPLDRIAATARTRTLTFSAVVFAAAVDAINPCAFAVLIILITTVLGAGLRRKALRRLPSMAHGDAKIAGRFRASPGRFGYLSPSREINRCLLAFTRRSELPRKAGNLPRVTKYARKHEVS